MQSNPWQNNPQDVDYFHLQSLGYSSGIISVAMFYTISNVTDTSTVITVMGKYSRGNNEWPNDADATVIAGGTTTALVTVTGAFVTISGTTYPITLKTPGKLTILPTAPDAYTITIGGKQPFQTTQNAHRWGWPT